VSRHNMQTGGLVLMALAIVVVMVLIAVVAMGFRASRRYSQYVAGLWVGEPKFLDKAGLQDFQLFLSPETFPEGKLAGGKRQGYLLVTDTSGAFVVNQAIEWEGGGAGVLAALKAAASTENDVCTAGGARITYDSPELLTGGPPVPETVKMSVSILDGTLTLFDDEKVYAFLQKDLASSAAAISMYRLGEPTAA